MPTWKRNIFVNAVRTIMEREGVTAEEALARYPALTEAEKAEILAALNA